MATVLVVDDDPDVRKYVATVLKTSGHDVLWADNGLEALMVYTSYRARLDLVLTDIDMPQMDGVELVGRIRASNPAARIVVMSGRPVDGLEKIQGCPSLLKPFLPKELRAVVESALKA